MARHLKDCHPGHGCFACPYHDCIRAVSKHMTADERRMRQAGYEKKPRMASAKAPSSWLPQYMVGVHGWHRMNQKEHLQLALQVLRK